MAKEFFIRNYFRGKHQKFYYKDGFSGKEHLLLDPTTYSKDGKRYSIINFKASPDGKFVSFMTSPGGSEFGQIRVVEVATGKETGNVSEWTRGRMNGLWLPDGQSFLYYKYRQVAEGIPSPENRIFQHRLGDDPKKDKPIFGERVNPEIDVDGSAMLSIKLPAGSNYAFATVEVYPNTEIYVAPVKSFQQATIPWEKIVSLKDAVTSIYHVRGDDLYMITYKHTPRFKVIRMNIQNPDISKADTVFPASEAVVTSFALSKDALYVNTLDAGMNKIWRVDYKIKSRVN